MNFLKTFTHTVLLVTTPSIALHPQNNLPQEMHAKTEEAGISHFLSYDEIINLLDDLESGELEKRSTPEDLEKVNHFLALLATEGALPGDLDDDYILEEDVEQLLNGEENIYQYAFSLGSNSEYMIVPAVFNSHGEIVLCKSWLKKKWEKTKKFVKEHKKEIIIGAIIVVAAATVVVAVTAATAAGVAAATAGAAGAAASSESNKEEPAPEKSSTALAATEEAPTLKAAIDEHVACFKEFAAEDIVLQSLDYSNVQKDPTFGEKARNLGALLAHETFDGISEITSMIPQISEEIQGLSSRFMPESILPPENDLMGSPRENYEGFVAEGHQVIDRVFSTDQAGLYTEEAKANDPLRNYGILPPPGCFSKGLSVSKFKKVVSVGKETTILAEEIGLTAREIAKLEKAGTLEKTVVSSFESLVSKPAMLESFQRFKYAEDFLAPYKGIYMQEMQVREYIHQAGVRSFPRPGGIPENFRVRLSKNGAGMIYVHPKNAHISVRVMPGKPHSINPSQQNPYVMQMQDGKALNKYGQLVDKRAPEAHIPIDAFVYKK